VAPADPLLLYPTQLRSLEAARAGGLTIEDGQFVVDGRHALVMLATRHSPFDAGSQGPLQAAIGEAFAAANAARRGLTLEQSAVARFALAAEAAMRADIGRISTISLVGLLLLFCRGVPLAAADRAVDAAAGARGARGAGGLFDGLFGSVHGLTLAFGATLIGVCIDYSVHLIQSPPAGSAGRGAGGERAAGRAGAVARGADDGRGVRGAGVDELPGAAGDRGVRQRRGAGGGAGDALLAAGDDAAGDAERGALQRAAAGGWRAWLWRSSGGAGSRSGWCSRRWWSRRSGCRRSAGPTTSSC
jgi:hypothetical protein